MTEIPADGVYVIQDGVAIPGTVKRMNAGVAQTVTVSVVEDNLPPDPPPDAPRTLLVGAIYNVGGDRDLTNMERNMGIPVGKTMDLHRCYEDAPPFNWSATPAAQDIADGRGFWISFKGWFDDWLSGQHDANMRHLCQTIDPNWSNVFLSCWHEPEPKLTKGELGNRSGTPTFQPQDWVDVQVYFYNLCKPLIPANTMIAPIHGAYNWRPGQPVTDPNWERWVVPYNKRDFVGFDLYGHTTPGNITDRYPPPKDPESMYDRMKRLIVADSGQKICLAETGTRLRDATGVNWIKKFLGDDLAAHPEVIGLTYWNSDGTVDPGPLPPDMLTAYGDVWRKYSPQSVGSIPSTP